MIDKFKYLIVAKLLAAQTDLEERPSLLRLQQTTLGG